jgi:hypothetical protein
MGFSLKKVGSSLSNTFKKVVSGTANFAKKAGSAISDGISGIGTIARQTANTLEKGAPLAGVIAGVATGDPLLGVSVSQGLSNLGSTARNVQNASNSTNALSNTQKAIAGAQLFNTASQGTKFQNQLNNNLSGGLSSAMGKLNNFNNSLAQVHTAIATGASAPPINKMAMVNPEPPMAQAVVIH